MERSHGNGKYFIKLYQNIIERIMKNEEYL